MPSRKKTINKKLILLVEDSPTQSEKLRDILEKHQYRVRVANNGSQALSFLDEEKPALVISDIMIPEMNGYELCQHIKSDENTWHIPVILLASLSDTQDVLKGLVCGADSLLYRPYREDYLLTQVEQTLAIKTLPQRKRTSEEVEIQLAGKSHKVATDPQQILTMLISTYEATVYKNAELTQAQEELSTLTEHLEDLVEQRTEALTVEIAERKQAEKALKQRAAQLALLNDIGGKIASILDLEELLSLAVRLIQQSFGYHNVFLFTLDPRGEGLVMRAKAGELIDQLSLVDLQLEMEKGIVGWAANHKERVLVNDVTTDPRYFNPYPDRILTRSELSVPLQIAGKVLGVLDVQSPQVDAFDENEAKVIETLADQIAVALENARLYQTEKRHAARLAGLQLLSAELANLREERTILETLVTRTARLSESPACTVMLLDSETNELVLSAQAGLPDGIPEGIRFSLAHPFVQQMLTSGEQPFIVTNIDHAAPELRSLLIHPEARAFFTYPIRKEGESIGVITLSSLLPHSPSEEEISTYQMLSGRVAAALENARLFEETNRRLQRLSSLHVIDTAISNSLDIHLTLEILLGEVLTQLSVHAADVLIYFPSSLSFRFACGKGFRTQALKFTHLRIGEGIAGRAAIERRMIHIPNLKEEPNGLLSSPHIKDEGFVTLVSVPLIAKGVVKGVLEIFHREPLHPKQEWFDFLEILAGQAAIAIDSIELYDYLQRSNFDLILAYDATIEGWSRALDLRDKETEGHTQRVTEMTLNLARALGIGEEQQAHIWRGALLHDIGKMGVPDSILLRPGPLTDEEWVIMKKHPKYAYDMLSPIVYLRPAVDIPYSHHEKWDGSGYPRGLKGDDIPLAAQLFAVVDVWDALTSDRPYRKAWPEQKALEYIREQAGKHFEKKVVEFFLRERISRANPT